MSKVKLVFLSTMVMLSAMLTQKAFAAVGTLTATNVDALLGDSTADAETGIYAIQVIAENGIVIVVGIAILFAGAMLVRRLIHGGARG